ncbi:hypothetical protein LTR37_012580 [Vermiconidia calcicola]|uniref:Uncharacterized protein n=1 Tax=Vermiconidia calcicola TaxID=1690605 RepID=A0ACC3MYW0_9PEZI|nr:hypothetical protein LTR37_012580 [Vermiconidia calcicola]
MKLPTNGEHGGHHLQRAVENGIERAASYGTAVVRTMTRTIVAREEKCPNGDDGSALCQKPVNTKTLPIVLGAVIPIVCAICVFIYLHRRNSKKQAAEDAADPHKSLDFGIETGTTQPKKGRFGRNRELPEMQITDLGNDPVRPGQRPRGLSMDMLDSPYLLPAGLNGSRDESLHSMSRIHSHGEHDPYRPVTFVRGSSETSRPSRQFNENGSLYSSSTINTGNEKSNLVQHAQQMPQSFPKRGDSMSPTDSTPAEDFSAREMHSASRTGAHSRKTSASLSTPTLANISENALPQQRPRKNSLPRKPVPQEVEQAINTEQSPGERAASKRPPRKSSKAAALTPVVAVRASDASYYGEEVPPPPPPPKVMEPQGFDFENETARYSGRFSIDTPAPSQQYPLQDNRMSVMGLRPLPQEDPQENAEQRANRIRSFYKEYFDDSRPHPPNAFYEDFDPAYLNANSQYYNAGGHAQPQAPFAQPVGRRAMTPPPRGAPQFMDGPGGHDRHHSTMSAAGPRGRPAQRMPPQKKLPPPKALTSLPTPHMLREDSALLNPIDFAPPTSFREMQNGRRPDSPSGIARPYSPSVKAFSPLVPSFDQLNVMPSPHELRKSGTFNSLDFAPPRFRGQESGNSSDAGSIRSARSGISPMQLDAVRAGAYRVSRIPKEYVTSREDLSSQLRPKMNLVSPS